MVILLDKENFTNIPYFLEVGEEKLPIIVAGRRPTCWNCSEIGHLTSECPLKKPTPNPKRLTGQHLGSTTTTSFPKLTSHDTTPDEPLRGEPWQIAPGKKTPGRLSLEQQREQAMLKNDPGKDKYLEIVNLKKKLDSQKKKTNTPIPMQITSIQKQANH